MIKIKKMAEEFNSDCIAQKRLMQEVGLGIGCGEMQLGYIAGFHAAREAAKNESKFVIMTMERFFDITPIDHLTLAAQRHYEQRISSLGEENWALVSWTNL